MCLLLLWKSERRKNNCYLVFGDKNELFLFFKKDKYQTRLSFAQEAHAPQVTGSLHGNRVNCWQNYSKFSRKAF